MAELTCNQMKIGGNVKHFTTLMLERERHSLLWKSVHYQFDLVRGKWLHSPYLLSLPPSLSCAMRHSRVVWCRNGVPLTILECFSDLLGNQFPKLFVLATGRVRKMVIKHLVLSLVRQHRFYDPRETAFIIGCATDVNISSFKPPASHRSLIGK